jgi:hypothetical protein
VQSLLDPPKRCDEKEGRKGESKEGGREKEEVIRKRPNSERHGS